MRYEWDQRKNRENQRKPGISFELASLVFEDQDCLVGKDRIDEDGEQRWHALGAISIEPDSVLVVLVAHVYRHPSGEGPSPGTPREDRNGEEIIRIISARWASNNEVRRYQEQEVD
jgi:uncharacterized protein